MKKGIQLSDRIRLFADQDEQGFVGVLTLLPDKPGDRPRIVSLHDGNDFRFYYSMFRRMEDKNFEWKTMKLHEIGDSE